MTVTDVTCFPVSLPFREPFVIANLKMEAARYIIVRIRTDTGITGWGEAIPAWEVTGETVLGSIDAIHHLCESGASSPVGQSIGSLEDVERIVRRTNPIDRPQVVAHAPAAKAALEQALLDICGKALSQPVCELFGATVEPVPVSSVIGIHPVDATLRRVLEAITTDPEIIKLKVGIPNVDNLPGYERDIRVIREAKTLVDAAPSTPRLVADANQGYVTPENALSVARHVDGCLNWLEQPILAGDLLGFRTLRDTSGIPLMADESIHTYDDARVLLKLGGVDLLNLKLAKAGGVMEAMRIADLAAEHGVTCQMGSMLEGVAGLAAGAHTYLSHTNIQTTELCTLGMLADTIGEGVVQTGPHLELSGKPGFGVDIDNAEIESHLVRPQDSRLLSEAADGFQSDV